MALLEAKQEKSAVFAHKQHSESAGPGHADGNYFAAARRSPSMILRMSPAAVPVAMRR